MMREDEKENGMQRSVNHLFFQESVMLNLSRRSHLSLLFPSVFLSEIGLVKNVSVGRHQQTPTDRPSKKNERRE
jgi:hypothetical protein